MRWVGPGPGGDWVGSGRAPASSPVGEPPAGQRGGRAAIARFDSIALIWSLR